ncbi:L,D-transpeptidase family protein [Nemorincola caseinilytica]
MMVGRLLNAVLCAAMCIASYSCRAQAGADFKAGQLSADRVVKAWAKYNDPLRDLFTTHGLKWPATDIYLRAFKLQNELELWARDNATDEYRHVKTYRICAISGALGPKRKQGDRQVPEGYYFIDEFNPNSDYHLSLHLSYPNYSDLLQGKSNPGGDIYIHGGCLTVGCLPMEDEGIREIYTLCLNTRLNGQQYIPVHIYPTHMNKSGMSYLQKEVAGNVGKQQFWWNLKNGYEHFEKHHKLQPVMYTPDGNYLN